MAIVYSTSKVHPRDRVSYWVEVATREFYRHTFRSKVGPDFSGELRLGAVGDLWVGQCTCDPCDSNRRQGDIVRDGIDDIILSVRHSGISLVTQGDRENVHRAGTMALMDTGRPNTVRFQSPAEFTVARIPRASIKARIGNLAELTARPISVAGPISGLAAGFLSMLAERAGALDEAAGLKLSEQMLDLVTLAFSSELGARGVKLSSTRAVALVRLKSVIEARLYDPELRPAEAAAGAGISVRYANALLSKEGSSVERYIQHRRLERCREALEDAAQAHRKISEIAFAWGYSDLSHFTRRFRAAYDVAPGDYRRRAQERAAAGRAKGE